MPSAKKTDSKTAAKPVAKKATAKKATKADATSTGSTDLLKKYRDHKGDNGSTDVQVIGLTEKITQLSSHLESHKKDHDARRGLLMMVGKRRRLLNYLKRQDETVYTKLIADLGLRK